MSRPFSGPDAGPAAGRSAWRAAPGWLAATAVATAALLAACAGSPITRYHGLPPVRAAAPTAYDGPPIDVGAVQVPPALARQELVRSTGGGQFEVREFDHWAAPLGRLARQALAEDLALRLPPGKLVFPGAAWPAPGAVLNVEVLSFTTADGMATMVLSWSLRTTDPTAPTTRGAQLRLQAPAGEGADATAQVWSELLGQLSDQVVARLASEAR